MNQEKSKYTRTLIAFMITIGVIGCAIFRAAYLEQPESGSIALAPIEISSNFDKNYAQQKNPINRRALQPTLDSRIPPNNTNNTNQLFRDTEDKNDNFQQYSGYLISGSEDEKIDAIKLLSKAGAENHKEMIEEYAKDDYGSLPIQLTAIEYMDWEKNSDFIGKTIQRNDGFAEAIILMASDKELSEETQHQVNEAAYTAFLKTSLPSSQIAILNYFYEQHSNKFDELSTMINLDEYSAEERDDALHLIKARSEDISMTSGE